MSNTGASTKLERFWYLRTNPWRKLDVAFVVSSGRTGTNFLGQFFNVYDHVHAVHEPPPDLFDLGMRKLREKFAPELMRKKILLERQEQYRLLTNAGKTCYIEANPFLSLLIPELIATFPAARFIFVTRDYPSYLLSAFNKSPDKSNQMFMYADDDHRRRLSPCDLGQAHYCEQWESWERHEKISWYWQAVNQVLQRDLKAAPKVTHLKYEDFFHREKGYEVLRGLLSFLGLPELKAETFQAAAARKVNANPIKLMDDFENFPKLRDQALVREIEEVRKGLGYVGC